MGKIIACTCAHPYQDERYGKNRRYHNGMKATGDYRCSVCGNVKRWQKIKA